jgi:hypothetical protein
MSTASTMRTLNDLSHAELSALLAGNPNAALMLGGGGQQFAGLGGSSAPVDPYAASTARNPAFLNSFFLQQQAEEQQNALLQQQLASLGGYSSGYAPPPTDNFSRLLQQQRQLQGLQGLQGFGGQGAGANSHLAALGGQGAGANSHLAALLGGSSAYPPAPTSHGASFAGLGQSGAGPMDSFGLAKLLQSQQQSNAAPEIPHASLAALGAAGSLPLPPDRRRKGRTGTFPQKLHQMLSDLEGQDGGSDIASFLGHGRAFAIHKPRDFVKHVMPKYFRMSRFSSFQRQLNLYDFQRITEGPDKGAYFHELFVHGRPILSTMMKRNKIKGVKNLPKAAKAAVQEPEEERSHEEEGEDEDSEDKAAV